MADDLNLLAGFEGLVGGISSVAVPALTRRMNLRDLYALEVEKARAAEQADIRKGGREFEMQKSLIPLRTKAQEELYANRLPFKIMEIQEAARAREEAAKRTKESERGAKLRQGFPKAQGTYNNTIQSYDTMIRDARKILNDPALGSATGLLGQYNRLTPGARRIEGNLQTLKSKTLLSVISGLKELSATGATGFGALSTFEGETLRDSIANMKRSLGTKDFKENVSRFISDVSKSKQNVERTFSRTYGKFMEEDFGFEEEEEVIP